jgi:hypothetical protein
MYCKQKPLSRTITSFARSGRYGKYHSEYVDRIEHCIRLRGVDDDPHDLPQAAVVVQYVMVALLDQWETASAFHGQ